MREINTTKLLIIAILGFCAVILGSAVLTLQLFVTQEKQRLGILGRPTLDKHHPNGKRVMDIRQQRNAAAAASTVTTMKPSQPISSQDLNLHRQSPPHSRNPHTIQEAYWRQAAIFLQKWDVLLSQPPSDDEDNEDGRSTDDPPLLVPPPTGSSSSSSSANSLSSSLGLWALKQAAQAGHPMAQHYVANALASGIWPVNLDTAEDTENANHNKEDDATNHTLHVFDEWSPSAIGSHAQLNKAFIYWHFASIGGNIEAAMALAHRMADLHSPDDDKEKKCRAVLPYLAAAAHGIMDQLEASPHSRGKIRPPMDKHMLPQVHMHGGTSSQLDWNNKPDESKEAIQFYHLKATQTPWSSRLAPSNPDEPAIDLTAAYTLAQLYHTGDRGVPQNLTKSLMYYEIAATHGHWESAGPAGTFYLWGIGTTQNVLKAWKLFRMGAPHDLEGCQKLWERSLASKQENMNCDATSLNGLGVLYLLGIPGQLPVDVVRAEKFFTLAKEMGNADAMYHLSMMWLGWKTHFKHVQDLQSDGMSSVDPLESFPPTTDSTSKSSTFALHYSERTQTQHKGPAASEVKEAHKLLAVAASKGHVQAKHRLAMMNSEGVSIKTNTIKHVVIKPNCEQAAAHYQWITEHANLQLSKRLRKAYKAYIDGNVEMALRNYLAAAETGSSVGQVNAAFLLERGNCLGLSSTDCAKASVRLWKAAAARGIIEASLRVGDFYYYGRLRGKSHLIGPFAWIQYFLFPEEHLPEILAQWSTLAIQKIHQQFPWLGLIKHPVNDHVGNEDQTTTTEKSESTAERIQRENELQEADVATAAQYYHDAAEKYYSPRAHFNLGFMYEWGLGLKQDFPLAKRHYDLAATNNKKEAELAVQIALWAMSLHQNVVKLRVAWNQRNRKAKVTDTVQPPKATDNSDPNLGQSMAGSVNRTMNKTAQEIILSHIFNWSSLVVLILLYIVVRLQKMRDDRRRR